MTYDDLLILYSFIGIIIMSFLMMSNKSQHACFYQNVSIRKMGIGIFDVDNSPSNLEDETKDVYVKFTDVELLKLYNLSHPYRL